MNKILEDLMVNIPDRGGTLIELESHKLGLRGLSYLQKVTKYFALTVMIGVGAMMAVITAVVALTCYWVFQNSDNGYLVAVSDEIGVISLVFVAISAALSLVMTYLVRESSWLKFFGYSKYLKDMNNRHQPQRNEADQVAMIRDIIREELRQHG